MKKFALPMMTGVLPALIAACAEPAPQYQQGYTVPEGCYVEADGEVECGDDDGHSVKPYKSASGVYAAPTRSSNARASSVSRGGFVTTGRAGGGSYGG